MKWGDAQKLHDRVVEELATAAERIPDAKWRLPRAEGKWSPAEVVEHVSLAYDVFMGELAGGPGMKIKAPLWMRIVLRLTMVPKILRGGGFPKGARAPREVRPDPPKLDQASAIAAFRKRAAAFNAATAAAHGGGQKVRLTHAYFGKMALTDAVALAARHIEHHQKQLV